MALNIHPAIVHIPIAFLVVYSLAEMIRSKKLLDHESWFWAKFTMLIVGLGGAFVSLSTGELAEGLWRGKPEMAIVEVHSLFANVTTWYFAVITLLYLAHILRDRVRMDWVRGWPRKLTDLLDLGYESLIDAWPAVLIGLVGAILITIVGALGGAIVYGPNSDPIVAFVYGLFF